MTLSVNSVGSAAEADVLAAELIEELASKLRAGEPVDLETVIRQHPEQADRLRKLLPAVQVLADLGQSAASASAPVQVPEADTASDTLGDFRILRQIGRGGMGVVYEAEQVSLGRRVALKVLPFAGALDDRQLQRFKNEAQAAAHLQHQNIVPVYFVGCERSVHFYAMQYVEGQTLAQVIAELRRQRGQEDRGLRIEDRPASRVASAPGAKIEERGLKIEDGESKIQNGVPDPTPTGTYTPEADGSNGHKDEKDPTVEDRCLDTVPAKPQSSTLNPRSSSFFRTIANLGIQAAEAIDHAHQMGVIHRDIKPGNILIENSSLITHDSSLRIWITDFGLAQFQAGAELTMTGDLVGTLRYMSPEQALAKRVIVDHRTDIYSLGATLYELLTLRPPYEGNDRQELLRCIAFEEPRPLRRINTKIPAELETIVLKAMEKNPADRYATAKELADDLRRYLQHEPIRAKKPTWMQRAGKWSRRHPAFVRAAVVMLFLITTGSSLSTWLIWQEKQRTTKAQIAEGQERDRAERHFQESLEVVDRLLTRVGNKRLADVPRMEKVRREILNDALDFYQRFLKEEASSAPLRFDTARAFRGVANIQCLLGQNVEAEINSRKSVSLLEDLVKEYPKNPDYREELARSLNNSGRFLMALNQYEEADQAFSKAQDLWQEFLANKPDPKYSFGLADAYHNRGVVRLLASRYQQAEPFYRHALELREKLVEEFPTNEEYLGRLALTYTGLGPVLGETGRLDEGVQTCLKAIEYQTQLVRASPESGDYREELASSYFNLARIYQRKGSLPDADEATKKAFQVQEELVADFPSIPGFRDQLAASYFRLGNIDLETKNGSAAEQNYRKAITHWNRLADDFPKVASYRKRLADASASLGLVFKGFARFREAA
ncbi:MAG TPA: serine/threonine-protein kinase, partial [Gemmataceae bacterium]|nr:serine/threonine-protein kinase [Gemmataceae bacterium]